MYGILPESQGHDLALTVLYVPISLDSGPPSLLPASSRAAGAPLKQVILENFAVTVTEEEGDQHKLSHMGKP